MDQAYRLGDLDLVLVGINLGIIFVLTVMLVVAVMDIVYAKKTN